MTGLHVTTADAITVEEEDKPTLEPTGYLTAALCSRTGSRHFRACLGKKDENSELFLTILHSILLSKSRLLSVILQKCH